MTSIALRMGFMFVVMSCTANHKLELCDILEDPNRYFGKTVQLKGVIFSDGIENVYFKSTKNCSIVIAVPVESSSSLDENKRNKLFWELVNNYNKSITRNIVEKSIEITAIVEKSGKDELSPIVLKIVDY